MKKGSLTPKGFRDIPPVLAKKRRLLIDKIVIVLEKFDFQALETPIIEFADTLMGKYGEDKKLIYQFGDKGGRYDNLIGIFAQRTIPAVGFSFGIARMTELLE